MDKLSNAVVKYKKSILIAFLIVALLSGIFSLLVSVNYDMVDYLPDDAQSTTAIEIMNEEFDSETPNARVMLTDVSIQEALEYKEKIAAIDGVTSISWLDDVIGLETLQAIPLDFLDISITESYYKDNNALINITIESGKEESTVNAIYELIGENNAIAGEAVNTAETQAMSVSEVVNAVIILLPIIILILIISTSSWIEPLLFLFTIGIAILINMGTNIIFGEISFITLTVSPVLQLAVSLDYAIFLLHSFNNYRDSHNPQKAMKLAMKQAFPTISASAATTIIGFSALMFMRFGIGSDLGINLVKGILVSFITVIVFLPVITLMSYKAIGKTMHRKLMPDFNKAGSWLMKVRRPFLLIAIIIVIPSFLAQANTEFMYGSSSSINNTSRVGQDTLYIEEKFGKENALVLLVPKDNAGKEIELTDDLSEIPHVTNVVSYVSNIGAEIPQEFVSQNAAKQFYSNNYTRILLYTDTTEEGDEAFATVENILDTAAMHYNTYYLAGSSATLYDMRNIVSIDTMRINLVAIFGIFIILLITFRSLILPLLLLFTIETAIWINLSFPYFTDRSLNFIGYLVLITVQLGATVDYAILFTNAYLKNRKTLPKKDAMRVAIEDNLVSILVSATILASTGFILGFTNSNQIIAELGILLGRGTILSLTMVAFVLPALLVLFDKVIQKTTLNKSFYKECD